MLQKVPIIKKLTRYLSTLSPKILTITELGQILLDFSKAINDPLDAEPQAYIDYLVKNNIIKSLLWQGPNLKIQRFIVGKPPIEEIAVSLKPNAYLSHLSAAHIHGLITKRPRLIYVSVEGPERIKQEINLEQEAIDDAFQKPQRRSGTEIEWEGNTFLLITAQHSGRIGIEKRNNYFVTGLERTLLDMTVRPLYGGGADTILKAYKTALPRLDVKQLVSMVESIDFIYPYHQAVGLYLSLASYTGQELRSLKQKPMPYRFYLEYSMKDTLYSREWNIVYPKNLNC